MAFTRGTLRSLIVRLLRQGTESSSLQSFLNDLIQKHVYDATKGESSSKIIGGFIAYVPGDYSVNCSAVSVGDTSVSFTGSPALTNNLVYRGDILEIADYRYLCRNVQDAAVDLGAAAHVAHDAQACTIYRRSILLTGVTNVEGVFRLPSKKSGTSGNMLTELSMENFPVDVGMPKVAQSIWDPDLSKRLVQVLPAPNDENDYGFLIKCSDLPAAFTADADSIPFPDELCYQIAVDVARTAANLMKIADPNVLTAVEKIASRGRGFADRTLKA